MFFSILSPLGCTVGNSYSGFLVSQVALAVKNLPANIGDARAAGSIPGSGRSPGVGNGNPLQYSCLENSTDRVHSMDSWATVHGVARSQT